MKTLQKHFKKIWVLCITIAMMGCSKTDDDTPIQDEEVQQANGVSADDLESYDGDLGLLLNVREIRKKGYQPATINLSTSATESNYDQELVIDPFTDIARLSYAIASLSQEAVAELQNGIDISIQVKNETGATILSKSYSAVSFKENGNQIDVDASSLNYQLENLQFMEEMRHYLQTVDANGEYGKGVVWKPSSALSNNVILEERLSSFNRGTTTEQYFFYKFPGTDDVFAIYSANTQRYLATDSNDATFRQSGAFSYPFGLSDNSLHPRYRFIIRRASNGLYTISDMNGNPMRSFTNSGKKSWRTNGSGPIQYFRIIALDIDWEVEVLDTKHLQPIFPPVDTSFGFNSTLRNCGSGTLEQEVGIEREVETTYTTSFSESIGLSGRVTTSVDVSVSATAEASFFGNGGSVTGEVSAGLEVSQEASSTTTVGNEESTSEINTFFSNRTVTVLPGSASLVYDAYQTYSNVKVPYVKRLRIKGTQTTTGTVLSGTQVATQLKVASFSGVITAIANDFVEITVKGNMFLDNIVDTQTDVRDVAANCD